MTTTTAQPFSSSTFSRLNLNLWGCALLGGLGGLASSSAWAFLPIEHWSQPSGAQVWLIHSPSLPMVDVELRFDGGSRRDPSGQEGLSSAVALMSSKGITAQKGQPALDENALGEAWADLGASFNAHAGRDSFSYQLRSLSQPDLLQGAAALASRQIAYPSWNSKTWQRERQRLSAALAESNTRPATIAQKGFAQAVYGSHPYGRPVTERSLAAISTPTMAAWHQAIVRPCRAKVSIVGALDKAQADTLVQQLLAQLPQASIANAACPSLSAVAEVEALQAPQHIDIPFASAQAHILLGQPGIARSNPDFLPLLLADHILGGGGFTSRLMEEVREKRGLTYGIYSSMSPGLHAGAFSIGLQTRPDQAEQALALTRQVLADFIAQGPTEEELQAAKDNLIGGFALRLDSNRKLLANLSNIAWNGLPLDYLDGWSERLAALSREEVHAALQRHWQPERLVSLVLGGQVGEAVTTAE